MLVTDWCFLISGQESEDDLGTGKQVRSKVWNSIYETKMKIKNLHLLS